MEVWNIRARITNNIKRFIEGTDYIDMEKHLCEVRTLEYESCASNTRQCLEMLG